ncbi:unnamed protein product [Rotaria sp. Silwood2]|nr:unnamed protein product [Rotaria sp. Silwood2]
MAISETTPSWVNLITNCNNDNILKSRTCKIYNRQTQVSPKDSNKVCLCGRLIRRHSFYDQNLQQDTGKPNIPRNHLTQFKNDDSTTVPITVYGRLKPNGCKFVRVDFKTHMKHIYNLLVDDHRGTNHKPNLILGVYGGLKYSIMAQRIELEIISDIVEAAITANGWILTDGINSGVTKSVGEDLSLHLSLTGYSNKVKCIGLTMWGIVNESTRFQLKYDTKGYPRDLLYRQISDNVEENQETIEKNHTHCILFDDGRLNTHLDDSRRHNLLTIACEDKTYTCYAVTIIFGGDITTLEILQNDIQAKRPIVLIQESGGLADVLVSLIETTSDSNQSQQFTPTDEHLKHTVNLAFPDLDESNIVYVMREIKYILQEANRHLLNVFSFDHNKNVTETIFKAIFTVKNKQCETYNINYREGDEQNQNQQYAQELDKLIDLTLEWNCLDGALPILQLRQNTMKKTNDAISMKENESYKLFKKSLTRNRPAFVEYFLAAGFDIRTLMEIKHKHQVKRSLLELYKDTYGSTNQSHVQCVKTLFDSPSMTNIEMLDEKLYRLVGPFIEPIYSSNGNDCTKRICIDMKSLLYKYRCSCCKSEKEHDKSSHDPNKSLSHGDNQNNNEEFPCTNDKLFRDLFLWSIFMNMPEMGKIFLFYLSSRICAALIASAIFKRYARVSTNLYFKEKFQQQALDFEKYAAGFINKCSQQNERLACELLLREIPLFGNITCMQVAISSEIQKLVATSCFDQALSQVWFNKLSIANHRTYAKPLQCFAILSFGLLAPIIIRYREDDFETERIPLCSHGINYYIDKKSSQNDCLKYWTRFIDFHQSPMIKMCYHFISYIWFLLVFSYMMLYHLDSPASFTIPHWTEIYVIITVSSMFCEDVRKLYFAYKTRMVERWHLTGSTVLMMLTYMFYVIPYLLFYLGLGFRYRAYDENILTTARIIWAFDLELWYIGSLKFIMGLKSFGPKLFMLKNMLRDLSGFVYMIFIAVAAYGVVSRAMIFYKQVPFTFQDIVKNIFYEPYWFIYGTVTDKDLLDQKLNNDTESVAAEATATHVLLAFHMLFINILILNLLIAVFTHTIDEVKENTQFYWRYQRYAFVREYFERPLLAYPPLNLLVYIVLGFNVLRWKCCPKLCRNRVEVEDHRSKSKGIIGVFKMIPENEYEGTDQWNAFENAATRSDVFSIMEENKKVNVLTMDTIHSTKITDTAESDVRKSNSNVEQRISYLDEEISTIKSIVNDNKKNIQMIHRQLTNQVQQVTNESDLFFFLVSITKLGLCIQINESLQLIMNAMEQSKNK